ncbi:MAG: pseudouridine synthase [Candidatus Saccharimonadales bacterium]
MRVNQFIAAATGISRRKADQLVADGAVSVNGEAAAIGLQISDDDIVTLNGKTITLPKYILIMLNKPVGYICSRNGQGAKTIYDLLPGKYQQLKPIGRLDKDSSGLLLLTNNGTLAQKLTHPKFGKEKVYEIELGKPLAANDKAEIEQGVELADGISKLQLDGLSKRWTVKMSEGRNRQIRRTFAALNYQIIRLHRDKFGEWQLGSLKPGQLIELNSEQ